MIQTSNLGMLLLAIYLIIIGAVTLFGLSFNGQEIITGLLAIAAGFLILIGR